MRKKLLSEANSLPKGAVFHRCALQVNPSTYNVKFRGAGTDSDPFSHAKAIVNRAAEVKVSVLAITNHNDIEGVPHFRKAARKHNMHVFPGFELTSSEGVHVLCLYPQNASQGELGRFLGEFGIRNTAPSAELSSKNILQILEMVPAQGGVAIAAHITNDNGLLSVLDGQAGIRAWKSKELLAVQIPGPVQDLPPKYRQIVENRNNDYRRPHAAGDKLAVAAINARDIVGPDDLLSKSATCWIKMSEVSIEGLKQAFLDPGSRIRLNPKAGEFEPEKHVELIAMTWKGGFLNDAAIRFNPNLNVLIGGRGTGKSTVVESIRAVLAIDAIGEDASKAYDGIVRHVLRSGTKISLLVRVHRPVVQEYLIERTIPNPPLVWDDQGTLLNLSPRDVLPQLEVYGQHEISELAGSREKLTSLLIRFVEQYDHLQSDKQSLRHELERNRRDITDAQKQLSRVGEHLAELPILEQRLEPYRKAGLEERLKEQDQIVREERVMHSVFERLEVFRDLHDSLKLEIPVDRAFLSDEAMKNLPGKDILQQGNSVFEELDLTLRDIVMDLGQAIERANEKFENIKREWEIRKGEVQNEYEKILRELQKSRVDGEEFIELRRKIERLRPFRQHQEWLQSLEKEYLDARQELLVEWEDIKTEECRLLQQAAKKVCRKLDNRVSVEICAEGSLDPLFEVMRKNVGGRLSETFAALERVRALSLKRFVAAWRRGAQALADEFGIPLNQAEKIASSGPSVIMVAEELDLAPTTEIKLNTAQDGAHPNWQTLENLSKGQKATAVLLLLLLDSDAPLVVDQPEDDLDNSFITEGVVPRIREEKQNRQFVFSTHNANIPVLGDAELIVGLSAVGEAESGQACIQRKHLGSIDAQPVRELVEKILEGGKDAFERRRRKYGF